MSPKTRKQRKTIGASEVTPSKSQRTRSEDRPEGSMKKAYRKISTSMLDYCTPKRKVNDNINSTSSVQKEEQKISTSTRRKSLRFQKFDENLDVKNIPTLVNAKLNQGLEASHTENEISEADQRSSLRKGLRLSKKSIKLDSDTSAVKTMKSRKSRKSKKTQSSIKNIENQSEVNSTNFKNEFVSISNKKILVTNTSLVSVENPEKGESAQLGDIQQYPQMTEAAEKFVTERSKNCKEDDENYVLQLSPNEDCDEGEIKVQHRISSASETNLQKSNEMANKKCLNATFTSHYVTSSPKADPKNFTEITNERDVNITYPSQYRTMPALDVDSEKYNEMLNEGDVNIRSTTKYCTSSPLKVDIEESKKNLYKKDINATSTSHMKAALEVDSEKCNETLNERDVNITSTSKDHTPFPSKADIEESREIIYKKDINATPSSQHHMKAALEVGSEECNEILNERNVLVNISSTLKDGTPSLLKADVEESKEILYKKDINATSPRQHRTQPILEVNSAKCNEILNERDVNTRSATNEHTSSLLKADTEDSRDIFYKKDINTTTPSEHHSSSALNVALEKSSENFEDALQDLDDILNPNKKLEVEHQTNKICTELTFSEKTHTGHQLSQIGEHEKVSDNVAVVQCEIVSTEPSINTSVKAVDRTEIDFVTLPNVNADNNKLENSLKASFITKMENLENELSFSNTTKDYSSKNNTSLEVNPPEKTITNLDDLETFLINNIDNISTADHDFDNSEIIDSVATKNISKQDSIISLESSSVIELPDTPNEKKQQSDSQVVFQTPATVAMSPVGSSTPLARTYNLSSSLKRLQTDKKSPLIDRNRRSIVDREQTPFKRNAGSFKKKLQNSISKLATKEIVKILIQDTPVSKHEIKETTALKSIRKRSLSTSDAEVVKPIRNRVTFHSPSNVTIPIDDIDKSLRVYKATDSLQSGSSSKTFKRTFSANEIDTNAKFFKSDNTPAKVRKLQNPTPRAKMPNFAAIHEQNFQKMESILDHVHRKAERAKVLSATKTKPDSMQKSAKKEDYAFKLGTAEKLVLKTSNSMNTLKIKNPKARQKIDLVHIPVENKEPKQERIMKMVKSSQISKPAGNEKKDKVTERQKRNMDLYKTRPRNGIINQNQKTEFIKGVRSNRRFELQMLHRNKE